VTQFQQKNHTGSHWFVDYDRNVESYAA